MTSLFKGPKVPKPPKPAEMPDQDDINKARRRSLLTQRARSGRQSNIFTGDDSLGSGGSV